MPCWRGGRRPVEFDAHPGLPGLIQVLSLEQVADWDGCCVAALGMDHFGPFSRLAGPTVAQLEGSQSCFDPYIDPHTFLRLMFLDFVRCLPEGVENHH